MTSRQITGLAVVLLLCALETAAQEPSFLDAMRADVVRMEGKSNTERGEILQSILTERGVAFELEEFEIRPLRAYSRSVGTNIVATLGDGDREIVIGGHYDAAVLAGGELSPAAVDNAASAVILTRVADVLADEARDARIRVVMYDMEEIGLLGSTDFVARHANPSILAAINLDINGYGDTLYYYQPQIQVAAGELFDAMATVCGGTEFHCVGSPQYPASDHMSFVRAGIPSISLAILPAAEVDALLAALNLAQRVRPGGASPRILTLIHTAQDKSELIEPQAMWKSYRAVLALIEELSPADE